MQTVARGAPSKIVKRSGFWHRSRDNRVRLSDLNRQCLPNHPADLAACAAILCSKIQDLGKLTLMVPTLLKHRSPSSSGVSYCDGFSPQSRSSRSRCVAVLAGWFRILITLVWLSVSSSKELLSANRSDRRCLGSLTVINVPPFNSLSPCSFAAILAVL